MDTVLFVNATIGFSENLFLVKILFKSASVDQAILLYKSLVTMQPNH